MTTLNIPKGADHTLTINLVDENNNVLNGTTFNKIVVFVKHANGTEIAKFSKNSAAGYGPMDISNIATGVLSVKLLTAHTNGQPDGKLFYEVHAQSPDSSLLDDSVLDLISPISYLCNIVDSMTGTLTLP